MVVAIWALSGSDRICRRLQGRADRPKLGSMDACELATLLVKELRKQMKSQPHNNIVVVPVLALMSSGAPGTRVHGMDIEAAIKILKDANLCEVVHLSGDQPPALRMTLEGRDLTDDQL